MQKAANMMEPEFGFLCQRDTQFEAGLATWAKTRPEMAAAAGPDLRRVRTEWQNELGAFRNTLSTKTRRPESLHPPLRKSPCGKHLRYSLAHHRGYSRNVDQSASASGSSFDGDTAGSTHKASPRRFCFDVEGITSLKKE